MSRDSNLGRAPAFWSLWHISWPQLRGAKALRMKSRFKPISHWFDYLRLNGWQRISILCICIKGLPYRYYIYVKRLLAHGYSSRSKYTTTEQKITHHAPGARRLRGLVIAQNTQQQYSRLVSVQVSRLSLSRQHVTTTFHHGARLLGYWSIFVRTQML